MIEVAKGDMNFMKQNYLECFFGLNQQAALITGASRGLGHARVYHTFPPE